MKLALCNEVIADRDFAAQCAFAKAIGYEGLEVAPYTIVETPDTIPRDRIKTLRRAATDAGIAICGLHWLLVAPKGLSITTDDDAVRVRTIDIMLRLVDLCAELGGAYLVHGSPAQRRLPDEPDKVGAARARAIDAFASVAAPAEAAGVIYCMEALAPPQANFINTVAEAIEIIEEIGNPAIRTMVDTSATRRQGIEDPVALINAHVPTGHVAHIQVNDASRRGPGQGTDLFLDVIKALNRNGYDKWVAVEPFEYHPDGPATAAFSAGYLRALIQEYPNA